MRNWWNSFDYLNNDDFEKDFDFIHDVGSFFYKYVDQIITKNKDKNWTQEDRRRQLIKRGGRLNLIYYMIEVLNLIGDWWKYRSNPNVSSTSSRVGIINGEYYL